ncbi:MAG TPA: hypothetical protein VFE23_05355 [Usitatibacter sp.]|nr:hypothetical protein [Usitatibacter sp.]
MRPRRFPTVIGALRRVAPFVLLAFALALGQQGALRHELGHSFERMGSPAQPQQPAHETCAKCFAYCAFAGGLPCAALVVPVVDPPHALDAFVPISPAARTVVTARSRAPPRLS